MAQINKVNRTGLFALLDSGFAQIVTQIVPITVNTLSRIQTFFLVVSVQEYYWKEKRPLFRLRCVAQNIYALCQWSACSPRTTLKPSNIKKITNFSRKTTLIRPQISKPHGAGVGRASHAGVFRGPCFSSLPQKTSSSKNARVGG